MVNTVKRLVCPDSIQNRTCAPRPSRRYQFPVKGVVSVDREPFCLLRAHRGSASSELNGPGLAELEESRQHLCGFRRARRAFGMMSRFIGSPWLIKLRMIKNYR